MLIYIASPYSHADETVREENFKKVSAIAARYVSEGHTAISPITYGHTLLQFHEMPSDWPFWQKFCLDILVKCDKLIVCKMQGWDKSKGVAEEIEFAKNTGIPIEYIQENIETMNEIEKWQMVNNCETIEELTNAVLKLADENGMVQGRSKQFDAERMAGFVKPVVESNFSPNFLTREYGIRQQALYLKHYHKYE